MKKPRNLLVERHQEAARRLAMGAVDVPQIPSWITSDTCVRRMTSADCAFAAIARGPGIAPR